MTPVTIEDIYKLFERSQEEQDRRTAESATGFDRKMAELAEAADRRAKDADLRAKEYDRKMAELAEAADRRAAEHDRRMDEYDRLRAESATAFDRKMAEYAEAANLRAKEADLRAADFDRRMVEIQRTVDRATKAVDGLTTRWGRFVEELVEPAVLTLFQSRGIDIKEIHPRAKTKRQGFAMEIDVLAVDDRDLVLVECKSRLSKDDVDEFIEKLKRFKGSFPHYANYLAYGAVAGIEIDEGIDRYAYRKGLFVIKPSGNTVMIANEPNFKPISW